MTSRDKILLPILIVLIGAGAFVFYKGFFAEEIGIATNPSPDTQANQSTIVNILPLGNKLDLSRVKARSESLQISPQSINSYPTAFNGDFGVEPSQLFGQ